LQKYNKIYLNFYKRKIKALFTRKTLLNSRVDKVEKSLENLKIKNKDDMQFSIQTIESIKNMIVI
jgi:hypothetical protein